MIWVGIRICAEQQGSVVLMVAAACLEWNRASCFACVQCHWLDLVESAFAA
jgi:hypothetical protein